MENQTYTEEQFCHEMLARLQEEYHKAAEPYVKRLVRLKSMEAPTLIVPREQWEAFEAARRNI